ncbi:MAG TPA: response regulator [Gaiellaceae bacterium]|nr:response regulator [Gaiellaceae bacterium]
MTRILLVEDDAPVRAVTREMLEGAGYCVAEAADAATALARVDERLMFEVLLIDVLLPDLSGLELARRIRARPDTSSVKILFTSGYPIDGAEVEAGDAFLPKPYGTTELLLALVKLSRRRGLPAGGST